ncbi:MAG: hypothetical protein IJQ77_11155 [Synergistaceae bacterium]|nr:hypothetical protein [Synergistaceae bacterium]
MDTKEDTKKIRDSNGRFVRGAVGNPKGRPKKQPKPPAPPTPEEVLKNATMEAIIRLIDLVHSDDEAIALQASIAILDRTVAKKTDTMNFTVPNGVKAISYSWGNSDIQIISHL